MRASTRPHPREPLGAPVCPACGGTLARVDGAVNEEVLNTLGRIARKTRPAVFYACNGCEFCAELRDLKGGQ